MAWILPKKIWNCANFDIIASLRFPESSNCKFYLFVCSSSLIQSRASYSMTHTSYILHISCLRNSTFTISFSPTCIIKSSLFFSILVCSLPLYISASSSPLKAQCFLWNYSVVSTILALKFFCNFVIIELNRCRIARFNWFIYTWFIIFFFLFWHFLWWLFHAKRVLMSKLWKKLLLSVRYYFKHQR